MVNQERLLVFLALTMFYAPLYAQDNAGAVPDIIKSPSPNGRFALRLHLPQENGQKGTQAVLIEKPSGKVLVEIGDASSPDKTVLVWSADSKRVAYATGFLKEGGTHVYFWNGTAFDEVVLPDELPSPDLKIPKNDSVKNYGGAETPLRWSKSGDLEMSSDLTMLSRDSGKTYSGAVKFIIAFDSKHHASVKEVGKTKTQIDE